MSRLVRSLRFRLACLGFSAIVVPLVVLSLVTVATETDTETEIDGGTVVTETVGLQVLSPWVWFTVVVVAAIAAPLSWWAAGRVVAPIEAIRETAERIDPSGLDQRVSLAGGSEELVRLGAAFDDMLDRLEAASRAERRRLAETSHDLRTPLAAIRSTADVLATDPAPTVDRLLGGHRQIADIAARLTGTVEDLLVSSRRQQHAWADRFDVVAVARSVAAEARGEASGRLVEIDIVIEGSEPVEIAADQPSLRRALTNLVDNAVRHAASAVTITIDDRPDVLRIVIANDGDPLPTGAPLFEPYWSGSDHDPRRVGLGLAIVAQVAEANGGTVAARSLPAPRSGAEFTIELPR